MAEPKKKIRKPEWDKPEQKAARMRKRRKEQKDFATQYGYKSWESLATALLRGNLKVVRNEEKKHEKTDNL